MIHLFQHTKGKLKGKFDIALVVKGKVIVFSNQGYERRQGCYKAIHSIMKDMSFSFATYAFQDDTKSDSVIYQIDHLGKVSKTDVATIKKYQA